MTLTTTTILLGLTFIALVALAAWYVDRQTVEVERVEHWHVHPEPLFDWEVDLWDWSDVWIEEMS